MAVTKGFGVEVARAAASLGLRHLGENQVQEAAPKIAALPEVDWHLVGHLQSNKVRRAVESFGWIHSVDSVPLLLAIERAARDAQRAVEVLLQVNVTGEESKSGLPLSIFAAGSEIGSGERELTSAVADVRHASVVGLMAIGRAGADESDARTAFRRLRHLRDRLQHSLGLALPELSMGMSDDWPAAVREGATLLRIGRGLFGERPAGRSPRAPRGGGP